MSDTNERSVASTGSHPVSGGPITLRLSNEEQQEMLSLLSGRQSGTLLPLDLPKPTLTDEEQLAIAWAAREADEWDEEDTPEVAAHAEALRGLAKRLF